MPFKVILHASRPSLYAPLPNVAKNEAEKSRIIEEDGMLIQEIEMDAYMAVSKQLVNANAEMVRAIKEKGQHGKVMWFVGQMMKDMGKEHGKGSVNAENAKVAVLKALA